MPPFFGTKNTRRAHIDKNVRLQAFRKLEHFFSYLMNLYFEITLPNASSNATDKFGCSFTNFTIEPITGISIALELTESPN